MAQPGTPPEDGPSRSSLKGKLSRRLSFNTKAKPLASTSDGEDKNLIRKIQKGSMRERPVSRTIGAKPSGPLPVTPPQATSQPQLKRVGSNSSIPATPVVMSPRASQSAPLGTTTDTSPTNTKDNQPKYLSQTVPLAERMEPAYLWKPLAAFATVIRGYEPHGKYQVKLTIGDRLKIQEQSKDWFKGVILSSGRKGIFPKNHVILSQKLYESEDDVMKELLVALWEWVGLLKTYYKERRHTEYINMRTRVTQLMDWYDKIKSPSTDAGLKMQLKSRVLDKIEEGRRLMGLDVIVRRPDGIRCTEQNTGIIKLFESYKSLANENSARKDKKKTEKPGSCIIFADLKLFACSVGEPTEALLVLWHRTTNTFISECFYVKLSAQGMPIDEDLIGNIKTIFKDVAVKDIESGVYLFIKLIKIGKLEKKGKGFEFRIPFGGALVQIKDLNNKESEFTLPVYTTLDSNFHQLPELIARQKDITPVPRTKGIIIGLSQMAETIENNISQIPKQFDLSKVCVTDKYGFPELIYPGTSRNDFYLTLESGEFSIDKTFEIQIIIKMNNGENLPDCIRIGTSSEGLVSSYSSIILYHNGNPRWNERISLLIPPPIYERCHVYFTVRTCSANSSPKEYANGFLKLIKEDGTVINDGIQQIHLFRLPKQNDDGLLYLHDTSKLLYRKGEFLTLNTLLCSTALTQNSYVRGLLRWNDDRSKLPEVLNRFTFGSQFEIIKFLQETFDAMCQILDANLENVESLVYDAIVFVIGILVDEKTSRFTNFEPVLTAYIEKHFTSKTAHETLLRCFLKYLESTDTKAQIILQSLKAFTFLLKIIKKSYQLTKKDPHYPFHTDTAFKTSIRDLFSALNSLMTKTSPGLIGAQTVLLKTLTSWYSELMNVFSHVELAELTSKLLNSIQKGAQVKNKINLGKLGVFASLVDGKLFEEAQSRRILVPLLFEHLNTHMMHYTNIAEVKACITVHSKILDFIHNDREAGKSILGYIVALLPATSQAFEAVKNDEVFSLEAMTCLLNIYHIIAPAHFAKFIEKMKPEKAIHFLTQQCEMMFYWCRGKTYPENWFSLKMFQMAVVKKMFLSISEVLKTKYLEEAPWDATATSMWLNFFQAGFAFLDSTALKLEDFSASKQTLIKENYGDMRLGVCALLKKMWDGLENKQNLLSNNLVKEFLRVAMISQRDLRNLGVNLYFSAIEKEFRMSKNFKAIESQTIDAFSAILTPSTDTLHTTNFNEFFFQALENKLIRTPDIAEEARKFLRDLKELCQHLVALTTLRHGDNEDDRTIATLRLMEYLKQSQRLGAYIRYVNSLVDQHTKLHNPVKAALILLLHSELLDWSDTQFEGRRGRDGETQFTQKFSIYEQAIDLLEEGLYFEKALELIQELRVQVQTKLYNYTKLATCLEREASLLRKMVTANRYACEYFRVAYYGKGFPSNLRGKEYIYCGAQMERIVEFTDRIMSKYPTAELIKVTEPPGLDITKSENMFIQIFAVKPFPTDADSPEKSHLNLPLKLREYRLSMINVNQFVYKRPFSKDKNAKKENEFKDLWTMDNFYITKEAFPLITDRSEIIQTTTHEVTPIENAIRAIKSKNDELQKLADQYKDSTENASPFTMVLSGTIDAAVSGGIDNYKKAFLSKEYLQENPNDKTFIQSLRDAFTQQLNILSESIVVHAAVCPESMQQLQGHLEEKLGELKSNWFGENNNNTVVEEFKPDDIRPDELEHEDKSDDSKDDDKNEDSGWARTQLNRNEPALRKTMTNKGTLIGGRRQTDV